VQQLLPIIGAGGSIILVSSLAAHAAVGELAAYAATKGAIDTLVIHLAAALGPRGIRVNAVAPGTIPTEGTGAHYGDADALRRRAAVLPLQRLGGPDDIAAAVGFLASSEAGWITGQVLAVDGGFLAAHGSFYRLARKGV
jgi:NAD(P)-dependent dehydrogenase (short-subunit alcohol dehydrogenase family)